MMRRRADCWELLSALKTNAATTFGKKRLVSSLQAERFYGTVPCTSFVVIGTG
jgi:hypothetical protein